MKKSIFVVSLLAVFALVLSACQAAPVGGSVQAQPQINASGEGKVYLTPDLAYINIGVHSQSNNVTDALRENNTQAQAVAEALQSMGVDPKDIQTSAFSIYPQPQYNQMGELTGDTLYMVDNQVFVTVRDLGNMGQLLDRVVTTGANSINGISFDVSNKDAAVAQARELAITNARNEAQAVAQAAGVQLGRLLNISVSQPGQPIPLFEGKGGAAAQAADNVPVSAGQMAITISASVSYEIQ